MNIEYINFLKELDKGGLCGNIQSVLLMDNLEDIPLGQIFKHLVSLQYHANRALINDNIEMSNKLNKE